MEKEQLLAEIKQALGAGQISRQEVLKAVEQTAGLEKHLKISNILYYIGGAIVFMGIVVLIEQNWERLSDLVKILVTLGSGAICYITAALLFKYEQLKNPSRVFFLLSALVLPIGFFITLDRMGMDISKASVQSLVFFVLLGLFLGTLYYFRFAILAFFSIIFGTALFHFLLVFFFGDSYQFISKIWEYQFLVVGLSFMLLGWFFSESQRILSGVLYGLGAIMFMGAALFLQGFSPNQSAFWELFFPILVFGMLYASVYTKSKSFLVFGSLALIAYIIKLTAEYFAQSLSWPLALVLAGLLIMGVGFYAVRFNRKYLKPEN